MHLWVHYSQIFCLANMEWFEKFRDQLFNRHSFPFGSPWCSKQVIYRGVYYFTERSDGKTLYWYGLKIKQFFSNKNRLKFWTSSLLIKFRKVFRFYHTLSHLCDNTDCENLYFYLYISKPVLSKYQMFAQCHHIFSRNPLLTFGTKSKIITSFPTGHWMLKASKEILLHWCTEYAQIQLRHQNVSIEESKTRTMSLLWTWNQFRGITRRFLWLTLDYFLSSGVYPNFM